MISLTDIQTYAKLLLRDSNEALASAANIEVIAREVAREIVRIRPQANQVRSTLTCVPGPIQTLPTEAMRLLDVEAVLDDTGAYIRRVMNRSVSQMDDDTPRWVCEEGGEIQEFAYEVTKPNIFWVRSPAAGGETLSIVYAKEPVTTATETELEPEFFSVLLNGVLSRLYMIDSLSSPQASAFLNAMYAGLGQEYDADTGIIHPLNRGTPDVALNAPQKTGRG